MTGRSPWCLRNSEVEDVFRARGPGTPRQYTHVHAEWSGLGTGRFDSGSDRRAGGGCSGHGGLLSTRFLQRQEPLPALEGKVRRASCRAATMDNDGTGTGGVSRRFRALGRSMPLRSVSSSRPSTRPSTSATSRPVARRGGLMIVDGWSDDGTRRRPSASDRPEARVDLQEPEGKGADVGRFESRTAPYVVPMDADGNMDPRDSPYVALFELGLRRGKARVPPSQWDSTDLTLLLRAGTAAGRLYNTMFRTRLSNLATASSASAATSSRSSASTSMASRSRRR